MSHQKKTAKIELPTSSMADIAFLLLTFFLVTTQIQNDKGLTILLPPLLKDLPKNVNERNLFNVQINSENQYMIEGIVRSDLIGLRNEIKTFIMNNGRLVNLSDNAEVAVVSLKTDRGTSYHAFIEAMDEIQAAYFEIYATQAGVSNQKFRSLDQSIPEDKELYNKGRKGIPMNISIAEPTRIDR